jgi:hypothetical protein
MAMARPVGVLPVRGPKRMQAAKAALALREPKALRVARTSLAPLREPQTMRAARTMLAPMRVAKTILALAEPRTLPIEAALPVPARS